MKDTPRRRSCEEGGREWSYKAISQRMPGAHRIWNLQGGILLQSLCTALVTRWFLRTSSMQNCETGKFYCFKPQTLWAFVMKALGK